MIIKEGFKTKNDVGPKIIPYRQSISNDARTFMY